MRRLKKFLIAFCFAVLTLTSEAHEVSNIYIKLERDGDSGWRGLIHFDAGYALPSMREDKEALQPKRNWLMGLSEEKWSELREGAEVYLRECLIFRKKDDDSGLSELEWQVEFPDFDKTKPDFPRMLDGGAYFRVVLNGEVPIGTLELLVREGNRPSFTISVAGVDDLSVVLPGGQIDLMERFVSGTEKERIVIHQESWGSRIVGFVKLGFVHVLPLGLDHVLFILALFFLSLNWRFLLSQSLMFTLAHTVTLALAVVGVVSAPSGLIEPLIALSIVWVAVENLLTNKVGSRRLSVVFVFGLIHGLGFAGVLSESLRGQSDWIMPLISMNIGVELAQISILLLCLVMFMWFADKKWYDILRRGASAMIALIGLWWFVTRIIN